MGKRLLFFGIIAVLALAGCATKFPPGEKWLQEPEVGPRGIICLKDDDLGETILTGIPDPELTWPHHGLANCTGGQCGTGPRDYRLAAANVLVKGVAVHTEDLGNGPEKLLCNEPDLNYGVYACLQNQPLEGTHHHFSEYNGKIYRASCDDWCKIGLPYGGTFHCDFIFLLKSDSIQEEEVFFDLLIAVGAEIPEKIKCKEEATGLGELMARLQGEGGEKFINLDEKRWIYVPMEANDTDKSRSLFKRDMQTETGGRTKLANESVVFQGEEYEAYQYLIKPIKAPQTDLDKVLYLTMPGQVDAADSATDIYAVVEYKEFRLVEEVKPKGFTLQLGTFNPPVGEGWWEEWVTESKPAVYLYPPETTKIDVRLNPAGKLTIFEPQYPSDGWQGVVAHPDGRLEYQGQSYPYLYYEADLEKVFVGKEGFIVKGSELVIFFEKTLPQAGLNRWETADFIQYWMKRLDRNQPYYFIYFLSPDQIERLEPLTLSVNPDTEIRIRPYFKPLEKPIEIKAQVLPFPPERKGFILVEWGGILDSD